MGELQNSELDFVHDDAAVVSLSTTTGLTTRVIHKQMSAFGDLGLLNNFMADFERELHTTWFKNKRMCDLHHARVLKDVIYHCKNFCVDQSVNFSPLEETQ